MQRLFLCDDTDISVVTRLATALGYGIEVQSFYDPGLPERDPHSVDAHLCLLDKIGARAMHGPFGDLCPGSFDPMVRSVARNRFDLAVRIASRLNATHVILHHGYVPGTSRPSGWLSRCTPFWQDFLDSVPSGITVHVENLLERDPDLLSEVVHAVGRDNLDICLDIGHAHCNSKYGVTKWIERLGRQIGYVHLHDNHGESDEHLGLGDGSIPMVEVCKALQEYAPEAVWALEPKVPQIGTSIAWLKENGFIHV